MKLNRKAFAQALESAASVADKKNQTPILANVLVRKVSDDSVEVIGSNLRTTISTSVPCEAAESFTVKAHDIAQIVAKLDAEDVTLEQRETKLEVSGGGAKFLVSMDKVRDWPSLPKFDAKKFVQVESLGLAEALEVAYAACVDGVRLNLSGVAIEKTGSGLSAVATDGHRLAINNVQMDSSKLRDSFVPESSARLIAKHAVESKTCDVLVDENMMHVRSGSVTVSAKLLEMAPPAYRNAMGDPWIESPAVVSRSRLIAALKRASIAGDDKGASGALLTFAQDSITVAVEGILNAAEEKVPCEGGVSVEIRCNLRYLVDGLEHMRADDVEVHVTAELNPICVRDAGMTQVVLVMPKAK